MKTLLIATQALVIGASAALAQSTSGSETPTPPPAKERAAGAQGGKGPQGDRRGGMNHHGQMPGQMPGMMNGMMPGMMYAMSPGQMPGYAMMPGFVMVPMMVPVSPQMMPMMHPGMAPHGDTKGQMGKSCDMHSGKHERGAHGSKGGDGPRWGEMRGRFLGDVMDDGQITREEFDTKVAEIFARLDANGDGVISQDEMPGRRFGKGPKSGADAKPAPTPSDN